MSNDDMFEPKPPAGWERFLNDGYLLCYRNERLRREFENAAKWKAITAAKSEAEKVAADKS